MLSLPAPGHMGVAVVDALADFPYLNARLGDQTVVVTGPVHLGIAVDLAPDGWLRRCCATPTACDSRRWHGGSTRSPRRLVPPNSTRRLRRRDLRDQRLGFARHAAHRAGPRRLPGGVPRRRRRSRPAGRGRAGAWRVCRRRASGRHARTQLRPPGHRQRLRRRLPRRRPHRARDPRLVGRILTIRAGGQGRGGRRPERPPHGRSRRACGGCSTRARSPSSR